VPVERFARTLAAELKAGADDAERVRTRAKTDLEVFLSPPEQQKRRASDLMPPVKSVAWSSSSPKMRPPSGAK